MRLCNPLPLFSNGVSIPSLTDNFILNRMEKNNYNIILEGIEQYRIEYIDKPNKDFH